MFAESTESARSHLVLATSASRRGCPKSPFPLALQVPESTKSQVGCVSCPKTGVCGAMSLPLIKVVDANIRWRTELPCRCALPFD